jgi:transposase
VKCEKYIGLDVHQATTVAAVRDADGKLVMESILETKSEVLLQFIGGLRGNLHVTLEEGTWAAWLYDLLRPHVTRIVVCNPRKNASLQEGSKSDRVDARKLAELLRVDHLSPVYHGEHGVSVLLERARGYLALVKDVSRVMMRLKAIYRSRGIACAGRDVYGQRHRALWLAKLTEAGLHHRAELFYEQLDVLQPLRRKARREMLVESHKHPITARLCQIPSIGPIRSALLVALLQTPHRFRTKRQLWAYSGLALETHDSGEYHYVKGELRRRKKQATVHGLNRNYNHHLKDVFKGAATTASTREGPLREVYLGMVESGVKPTMARLTLARKIAAITLTLWKRGENFTAEKMKLQAA